MAAVIWNARAQRPASWPCERTCHHRQEWIISTLFVIATPIGNLDDLSPRARQVLGQVPVVAAEDTRTTRKLLSHLGLHPRLVSFHQHSDARRHAAILSLLEQHDVALVSEAGSPGVSDPGCALVAEALAAGHQVVAVPGPSAVTAALSVSGLPADSFLFLGFLPRHRQDRQRLLGEVASQPRTLVAFETPHRLRAALDDLVAILGNRTVVVARELTKLHEEVWRGTLEEARRIWARREPRGEYTLVIAGAPANRPEPWEERRLRAAVADCRARGIGARETSRRLAEVSGHPARRIYRLWLELGEEQGEGEGQERERGREQEQEQEDRSC